MIGQALVADSGGFLHLTRFLLGCRQHFLALVLLNSLRLALVCLRYLLLLHLSLGSLRLSLGLLVLPLGVHFDGLLVNCCLGVSHPVGNRLLLFLLGSLLLGLWILDLLGRGIVLGLDLLLRSRLGLLFLRLGRLFLRR